MASESVRCIDCNHYQRTGRWCQIKGTSIKNSNIKAPCSMYSGADEDDDGHEEEAESDSEE